MTITLGLGWKPDTLDPRDHRWAAPPGAAGQLPRRYRIPQRWHPPVWDQHDIGSCTAFAGLAGMEIARRIAPGQQGANPSRLFTYWTTRELESGPGGGMVDSGASIRATVKALVQYGAPPERLWPYGRGENWHVKPPAAAFEAAERRQVLGYRRVMQTDVQLAAAIWQRLPIVFGALVFEQMMTEASTTGRVAMPNLSDAPLGGHAMLIVGYDFDDRTFEFRNSWGKTWGQAGHGTFPMEYLTHPDLAADFWVIQQAES